jgi:hypothetical protein
MRSNLKFKFSPQYYFAEWETAVRLWKAINISAIWERERSERLLLFGTEKVELVMLLNTFICFFHFIWNDIIILFYSVKEILHLLTKKKNLPHIII